VQRPFYRATGDTLPPSWKWRPSIFMPRWASRITLEVTEVRIERVASISEYDAQAEGVSAVTKDGNLFKYCVMDRGDMSSQPWVEMPRSAVDAYAALWSRINGEASWAANPWVWALTFKRVDVAAERGAPAPVVRP
jgi:hypothetical protein